MAKARRALVYEANGCLGSHLVDTLIFHSKSDIFVTGLIRQGGHTSNLNHLSQDERGLKFFTSFVVDRVDKVKSIGAILGQVKPDVIYYINPQNFVPESFEMDPYRYLQRFILPFGVLGQSVLASERPTIKIVVVGSADQYGDVPVDALPIREEMALNPVSPFGAGMCAQELLAECYSRQGLQIVMARLFNYSGPRREEIFIDSNFAFQLARINAGKQDSVIKVGDLSTSRDFTDVRDVAAALIALADLGICMTPYNICSGRGRSGQDILDQLIKLAGIQVEIMETEKRLRPTDPQALIGSNDSIRMQTGWQPVITYKKTLMDLWGHWCHIVRGSK